MFAKLRQTREGRLALTIGSGVFGGLLGYRLLSAVAAWGAYGWGRLTGLQQLELHSAILAAIFACVGYLCREIIRRHLWHRGTVAAVATLGVLCIVGYASSPWSLTSVLRFLLLGVFLAVTGAATALALRGAATRFLRFWRQRRDLKLSNYPPSR